MSNVTSLTDISIGEELPAGPVVFTAPPIALHQAQFSRRQRMRNRRSGSGRRKKPNLTTNIPSPTESMPWFEEVRLFYKWLGESEVRSTGQHFFYSFTFCFSFTNQYPLHLHKVVYKHTYVDLYCIFRFGFSGQFILTF